MLQNGSGVGRQYSISPPPTDLAFGAPVVDASGRGLGAINISVSSTRWTEEKAMKTFPALVRETALAISANLRDRPEVV